MIYLNNAATSFPKPPVVLNAISDVIKNNGGNPGRSADRFSLETGNIINDARFQIAGLFGVSNPNRVIFTYNATDSLNLSILGILKSGDHVITSTMEHNSVTRPLHHLEQKGITVIKINMDERNGVNPSDIKEAINENVKLVVLTHISNVTGTINPIEKIGKICREKKVLFLVDASQSAGVFPINMREMNIDFLAFPGHKALLGPTGTGVLCIGENVDVEKDFQPIRFGGTGVQSESLEQPKELPFRYEAGTLNVPGIAGLSESVRFIKKTGLEKIRNHEIHLMKKIIDGLSDVRGIKMYGTKDPEKSGAVLSINIEGFNPMDVAMILDTSFGISVRAGLHCAPDAHRTLGTIDGGGTLRISPGYFTTENEIDKFIGAIKEIK